MKTQSRSDTRFFGHGLERVAVRPITDRIFWLTHCLGDLAGQFFKEYFSSLPNAEDYSGNRIVDYPFSAFLIVDEKSLLIDTCGPKQRQPFLEALRHVLGERPLEYIWISHVELPHAGNAPNIKQMYPDARIVAVAGGENYQLHGLHDAETVAPGDVLSLGTHEVEMVDALFVDHGLSQWLYERISGMLFTADWAHNLHEPALGHCVKFLDEMMATGYDADTFVDDLKVNAWYQFPWLAWGNSEKILAAIDALFAQYDVRILAASHGSVIRRDAARFIPHIKEGMRRAAEMPFSKIL